MKCFVYGARPPVENAEAVREQLWLAHRFYNKLIEIEHEKRAAMKPVLAAKGPAENIEAIKQKAFTAAKEARHASGVFWGTYLLVLRAAAAACDPAAGKRRPVAGKQGKKPRPWEERPSFGRWDGTGQLGIQIQIHKRLTIDGALACTDTRLRIERTPDPPDSELRTGSRRAGKGALVHMRIGGEGRDGVWASWPVTLHRLPPSDADIKYAWMQRKRVGPDYKWYLMLSIDEVRSTAPERKSGTVAVDLGWRVRPDSVRAAYWVDDKGNKGEILLPPGYREAMDHADEIAGIRDCAFNKMRNRLREWLSIHRDTLPQQAQEMVKTIGLWKSPAPLARLAKFWSHEGIASRDNITKELYAWRRSNRHLYAWTEHEAHKALGHRNEMDKLIARDFAVCYGTIVLEDFDLLRVAGRKGLSEDADAGERVRADRASSVRHLVAPGILRDCIVRAAAKTGSWVLKVEPAWSTIDCWICGVRMQWDPAPEVEHRCAACGNLVDQDEQACRNLLQRAARGDVTKEIRPVLESGMSKRQQRFRAGRRVKQEAKAVERVNLSQVEVEEGGVAG